jgi:hypothetical protein
MKKKKYPTKDTEYNAREEDEWNDSDVHSEWSSTEVDIYDDEYETPSSRDEYEDEEDEEDEEEDWEKPSTKKAAIVDNSIKIEVESINQGPKKRGPKPQKTEYYVEPKEFDEHIIKYYESNILTNELATMVSKIAHKLSYAPNFINYTYREEMVGDAIVRMMKALTAKKYCHIKGNNPFSYFTKIAFNAFRNRIKREKHMHETLQRYREDILLAEMQPNNFKNKNGQERFASHED